MSDTQNIVEVRSLSRQFRKKRALDNVTLDLPKGVVLGLVGENGAGKTTLIKHLLGLFKAQSGSVRVFGLDPVREPEKVLVRVGYLSENREMPGWMRISELMRYTQAFYPTWDAHYAEELRETFGLDPDTKVKHLSRGQKAQAGLLIALAYRPDLLLLDEPSSGLDPVVRRDILTAIIRTVADEGRTVLFSSHLLDEVERVADHVVMLHKGKLAFSAPLDEAKAGHRRFTVRLAEGSATPPPLPGTLYWLESSVRVARKEWTAICNGQCDEFKAAAAKQRIEIVEESIPSIDEIFIARVRGVE
ncbi:MAG: ABC transporter ATP-binding protein [Candidatus Hydrogenedentes bacterium]|nr:ABC transporter ATP-binding protein [Candidatus Hydrogenedentota bacterium]